MAADTTGRAAAIFIQSLRQTGIQRHEVHQVEVNEDEKSDEVSTAAGIVARDHGCRRGFHHAARAQPMK
jgi:hypothetical protein